jgi:hypothetical protein
MHEQYACVVRFLSFFGYSETAGLGANNRSGANFTLQRAWPALGHVALLA